MSKLKKGYTTGVHASFVFKSALESFLSSGSLSISKSNKMENDDLDVTKGCEIVASISQNFDDLVLNQVEQTPQKFSYASNSIEIYAGDGVGVVTKNGLKIEPNFPAINPVPLKSLKKIFENLVKDRKDLKLYCTIGITNGKKIAQSSANKKVGVLGGLSILGTTGFVKPISTEAYLDSISSEIGFIKTNNLTPLVFTIGNSSLEFAKESYSKEQIVEIGNFVYDSLEIANSLGIKKVVLICGIGKMTKIAQHYKNTHNRFGEIDFLTLEKWLENDLNIKLSINSINTVKELCEKLNEKKEAFYKMVRKRATRIIKEWFIDLNVEVVVI